MKHVFLVVLASFLLIVGCQRGDSQSDSIPTTITTKSDCLIIEQKLKPEANDQTGDLIVSEATVRIYSPEYDEYAPFKGRVHDAKNQRIIYYDVYVTNKSAETIDMLYGRVVIPDAIAQYNVPYYNVSDPTSFMPGSWELLPYMILATDGEPDIVEMEILQNSKLELVWQEDGLDYSTIIHLKAD